MKTTSPTLRHENLDVYQASISFLAVTETVVGSLPRGSAAIIDQLRRAAMSVPLNIAEGYAKSSPRDGARIFDIARGSAHECGAIADVMWTLHLIDDETHRTMKALLVRMVSMLVKLVRR